ncbi:MAG TPA: ABC transporter permease [Candidatus Acidoferrales bacterium]|nr:ABC transporter permease [Candidatus Acidoferrales bacterium]
MKTVNRTWTLTKIRWRLAMRNRAFFFFSLVMPMIFLFGAALFLRRESVEWIPYVLGAVLTTTVMGSFWGLSVQLVSFREQGILRRFRLAPVGAGPILASSILSNYFMALPVVVFEFLVCRWAFHMHTWGNLWAVLLLVTVGSATFSALGLIVASVTNTMQETQMINNLLWMGFLFLTGATVPLAIFPMWLQRIALFIPGQYLATGLEAATTNMATGAEVLEDVAALALGCFVAFEISRHLFRWEPEARVPRRAKLWALFALVPFLLFGAWENIAGTRLHRVNRNFERLNRSVMLTPSPSPH